MLPSDLHENPKCVLCSKLISDDQDHAIVSRFGDYNDVSNGTVFQTKFITHKKCAETSPRIGVEFFRLEKQWS